MVLRRGRVGPVAFGVVALAVGCSSGSSVPTTTTTTPVTAPATAAPTTTTTSTTVTLAPQPSPDQAAQALLGAWRAGDRGVASRVASASAVAVLFGQPPQGTPDRGCQDPVGGSSNCAFGLANGGLLTLHASMVPSGLWLIDGVQFG